MKDILPLPINDRVLVQYDEHEKVSTGGIVLPDNTKDKQEKPKQGIVLKLGHGVIENGQRRDFRVGIGDRVWFHKYGGHEIEIAGKKYILTLESEISAHIPAAYIKD